MIRNQRGGIVSFGIVALVLFGLLAGGLYFSKQQARVARDTDTTTPQVATPKKDTSSEKTTPAKPKTDTASTPASSSQDSPKPAAQTTSSQTTPNAETNTPADMTARVASTGPSAALPSTGPGDVALVTVGLSALGFTAYGFYRSRRDLQRAALRK